MYTYVYSVYCSIPNFFVTLLVYTTTGQQVLFGFNNVYLDFIVFSAYHGCHAGKGEPEFIALIPCLFEKRSDREGNMRRRYLSGSRAGITISKEVNSRAKYEFLLWICDRVHAVFSCCR